MPDNFPVWWHGIPALPAAYDEQAYFALRRVWADHTINTQSGARSIYRWTTEDYLTLTLWQTWAMFDDLSPLASFLRTAGAKVGILTRVRWAYACEEMAPHLGRKIIPDIMLAYEDEHGQGLVALEVKRPGIAAKREDAEKLGHYCRLPSARTLPRRQGCFLVSESKQSATNRNTGGEYPIVTWEQLAEAQAAATRTLPVHSDVACLTDAWIRRHFARAKIGVEHPAPASQGLAYAMPPSFEAIRKLGLPRPLELFLMGSECVEAAYGGRVPAAPLAWLGDEPQADEIRRSRYQTTADRRVCRWNFGWSPRHEARHERTTSPGHKIQLGPMEPQRGISK